MVHHTYSGNFKNQKIGELILEKFGVIEIPKSCPRLNL